MIDDKKNLKKFIFSNTDFTNVTSILDLGCGNGDDLKLLLDLYPKANFKLTAIDKQEDKISDSRIKYVQHDINKSIPFMDNSFDLVYSHNFFECVQDKSNHIKELHRILKKNGQVVYSHTDWDSQLLDGDNKELIRNIFKAYAEWQQPWMDSIDSWLGRRLRGIFNNSNLFKGNIKSYTIINTQFSKDHYSFNMINSFSDLVKDGLILQKDLDELINNAKEYDSFGKYFYSITNFIYYGYKI